MRRLRVPAVAVGVVMIALTGCADSGVADSVTPGIPDGFDLGADGHQPGAMWVEDGARFAVVTFGSSSCRPIATALTVEGDDELALTFAPSPHDECTADFAPTTHEFDLPDRVTGRPVTITVTYEDTAGANTLVLD